MPAASATLSSPNLSRSLSTAWRALRQRVARSLSSRLSCPSPRSRPDAWTPSSRIAERGLRLRRNVAFPVWALVALVAAFFLSLTQAGAALGVEPLTAGALAVTAGVAAVGVAIAAAGRVALPMSRRL